MPKELSSACDKYKQFYLAQEQHSYVCEATVFVLALLYAALGIRS